MCGRYLLRHAPEDASHSLWRDYWKDIQVLTPRYNIAPSQPAIVLANEDGIIHPLYQHFGFQPTWSKKLYINAKAETVFDLKTFKGSARHKPCLIAADGFYEPQGEKGGRRPWYGFHFSDDRPFFFAGIWTTYRQDDIEFQNFAIITKPPNSAVEPIHNRMPVMWDESQVENCKEWLDTSLSYENRQAVLNLGIEYPDLIRHRVSDKAKAPKNEGKECFKPESPPPQNEQLF